MPHPQTRELRGKLGEFFSNAPGLLARRYRTLTVFESDTGASILLGYSEADEDEDDAELDDDEWDALVEEPDRSGAEHEAAGGAPAAITSQDLYVEDGHEMLSARMMLAGATSQASLRSLPVAFVPC